MVIVFLIAFSSAFMLTVIWIRTLSNLGKFHKRIELKFNCNLQLNQTIEKEVGFSTWFLDEQQKIRREISGTEYMAFAPVSSRMID